VRPVFPQQDESEPVFLSVFDVFKIGIGPSSSHTMGPMTAAVSFLHLLQQSPLGQRAARLRVTLHGSLAFTGKGHATDRAVALGLLGCLPAELDVNAAEEQLLALQTCHKLCPAGLPPLTFDPASDIVFDYGPPLPGHANGLVFSALDAAGKKLIEETYYSIGGGFVVTAAEREHPLAAVGHEAISWPYPFNSAASMLQMARQSGLSIAAMKRENEAQLRGPADVASGVTRIWSVMNACIDRGLRREGDLPGGLRVRRRAHRIYNQLLAERQTNSGQPHTGSDWLSVYAMAVNEENAAGGQVVTAPTNGAAGVVPSVLRYYLDHCHGADPAKVSDFLLTAAAMAAAGLCAVLGGTPEQVENAAEIALEHHLGMTCDPVAGLVQVPCIERNGIGATKAVAAASLALRGDGSHFMPLDNCIKAMRQTGEEMNTKFKETSLGGLAVNLPEC